MTAVRGSEFSPSASSPADDRQFKPADPKINYRDGVLELPNALSLHFGGELSSVRVAWRLTGNDDQPVIVVLGGISAGRFVFPMKAGEAGWWKGVVGPNQALDAHKFRILGIDFLGGSGDSTGPRVGDKHFPSVSAYDQAALIVALLQHLNIQKLLAICGASYGGMVALAFAERFPKLVEKIIVISAADHAHPLSTAWRSVQRATVKAMIERGDGAAGLKLARALAMATYRSADEFAQRFDNAPQKTESGFRFPVEDYLYARGQAYADSYVPEAFVCLSESIDLHRVDATKIKTTTTLVAVREDQLVPLADMQALRARLAGTTQWVEISSLYGHDAFLKESVRLRDIFSQALA